MNYNKALDNGAGGPDEISDQQFKGLLQKFQQKGFDGMSLEEVATALILPNFAKTFNQHTGLDWTSKFEVKAIDRLNRSKFDIQWMARKDNAQEHTPLYVNCARGDLPKVRQYLKDCRDANIKQSVDSTKKSPIHIACIEGHLSIVELLIMTGFNPNCRDRTLKTPLHYAALHGHETIVDTLLKSGADINARDSLGRSCVHYAASCPSATLLQLILSTKPELANDLDHKRRNPLHYCVWNSSSHQVDLLRTLLDFRCNPMALDDDLKTPIHHAAEGGKTRAIPIILQRGGQEAMQLRDRSKRTPLELAANDRTREVMVVYSSSPMNHNPEDLKYLNQAVQGQKVNSAKQASQVDSQVMISKSPEKPKMETRQFPVVEHETLVVPPPKPVNVMPTSINQWIREKFFTIMKKVQAAGIGSNHHLKRPYVYTGSWMEGINTMEELYASLKDVPAGEVCVRSFNILCPYDRALPAGNGNEDVVDGFYGEQWFEGGAVIKTEQYEEQRRKMQMEYLARITDLETSVQLKEKALFDADQELAQTRAQLEVLQRSYKQNEQKLQTQIEQQTKQLKSKEEAVTKYSGDATKLQQKVKVLESEVEELRNAPQGIPEEEVQQYQQEITELREQLQQCKNLEKTQRQKAGQLFLKTISTVKSVSDEKLNQLKIQQAQQLQQIQQQAEAAMKNKNQGSQIVQKLLDKEKEKSVLMVKVADNAVGGMDNLQDDDAIIVLLKALKGNPPPMKQRMKQVDADLDGKVTQDEFKQFLGTLKMSQSDIHSLCRIAGFMSGTKLLGIDNWAQILQDRPKQREQFEQMLFNKLLDAIKSRNLTIEKVFELIDTDGSGSITPSELKEGLRSLKIILNQKDLNNMFSIFDGDKSGTIQLEEMKEILDNYEKMRQANGDDIVVDEEERMQVDVDNPYSEVDIDEQEYKQELKEWVIDVNDFNGINGDLKIQLNGGSAQDTKSIYCKITLRGATSVDRKFILFKPTEFKQAFIIPIRNTLKENLCEYVWVQMYRNSLEEDNFIGDVRVMWKDCITKPSKWTINNKFILGNTTYIKEQAKMYKPQGFIQLQCKYIPIQVGEVEEVIQQIGEPTFVGSVVEDGILEIIVVQCILEKDKKNIKDGKYFCELKFMKQNHKMQALLSANDDLYWESRYLQDLVCVYNQPLQNIHIKLIIETPTKLVLTNTAIIGEFYINWNECILHPYEYLSQKSYQLSKQSKVYIKVRYVPHSMLQNLVGFRDQVSEKEKRKQLTLEDMQSGTLKILFVRGKNLRADDGDTSDPYIIAKVHNFDQIVKIQSKTIKSTLNPEWRDLQSIKIMLPKEAPYPPLELEVFDEDVLGDDELGKCKVDLAPCVTAPCTWGINSLFTVDDPKAKEKGQVYIQCYWVPQGMKDPNLKAKDKEDASANADSDPNFIDGTLMVRVVHARELLADNPDPYVLVYFPGPKELKTASISSSNNPVFNQTLQHTFKIPKDKGTVPIKVMIKDSNFLTDSVVGYVDMPWEECVKQPGEWAVNQVHNLSATAESKKFGTVGYVYLQAKFLERGMIDDLAEAPLVENLNELINSKQGIYQGTIRIFLVHARNLVVADDKTSDPYVVFKVPGGKKLETQVKKETLNASWKTIYPIAISMPKDTIQPLRIEVFDDDLIGDEMMGYTTVDLSGCFQNPQQWKFNEVLDLQGDLKMQQKYKTKTFGKIYLQIMYCQQGIQNNDVPLPLTEDLDEILREQKLENKKPIKGVLHLIIPVALGLKPDDGISSDPYCKITFPDKLNVKTKHIEKTLNPEFNFKYKWNCNIIKEQYKPIHLQVYDADTVSDDLIGEAMIEWEDCYKNPTLWQVNKLCKMTEGEVYVQMQFLLPGQELTPAGQMIDGTIPELKNDYGKVLGKIDVKIVSATGLYNADLVGKSDPFVECYLTSEVKKMKTPVIENNLDPKWDFEGTLLVDLLRCQVQRTAIKFDVMDDDEVGSDFLGTAEIDLMDVLEKNPGSAMIGDYPLKNPEKKGTPNLGSIRLELSWVPDPNNEGVVGLRAPPKMYKGQLAVRFPNGRQLPKGDPFIYFNLTHNLEKSYQCKHMDSKVDPDWNYEELIDIDLQDKVIQTERIKATVKNYNMAWKDTSLGGIMIPITDVIQKSGTWINQYYQLYDDDGKKINSYIYVQVQFRQEGQQCDTKPPPVADFQQFINAGKPPTFSGKLKFTYIGLKNLKNMDLTGLSDPFVEIKISKGSTTSFKTTTQDDKSDCFWKDPGEYIFKDILKEDLESLTIFIVAYDYDYNSNDTLGKTEYDLSKMKSGQWINQRIPLLDEKGFGQPSEIYIQCQFLLDNQLNQEPQPANLYEDMVKKHQEEELKAKQEKEAQAAIPKVPGALRVFAIFARNLKKADTFGQSDPFVEFKLSKGSKAILKTTTIDDNPNPKWDYTGEFRLEMQPQEYIDIAMMSTVYDYDTLVSSDFLGFIELNLNDIFKTPGSWINNIFMLKDEHGNEGSNGDIYLQVQWVPDNLQRNLSLARPVMLSQDSKSTPKEAQQAILTQSQPPAQYVTGVLFVAAIKIINYDAKSQVIIKVDNVKVADKVLTSNMVQSGVAYNLKGEIDIKLVDTFKINIQLMDDKQNKVASKLIDIQQLITAPGTWINDSYTFDQNNLTPNNQKIYLQMQWRLPNVKVDTTEPELKMEPIIQQPQQPIAVPQVIPKGKIKIGVIKAEQILLLDGGKSSNTKIKVTFLGTDYSTDCVKGASPIWKAVLGSYNQKYTKIEEIKPMVVQVFHDPGFMKSCIQIGEVTISDISAIFTQPNNWAIKNDYLLGGVVKETKSNATGIVTLWIGFVGEKDKDNLVKI